MRKFSREAARLAETPSGVVNPPSWTRLSCQRWRVVVAPRTFRPRLDAEVVLDVSRRSGGVLGLAPVVVAGARGRWPCSRSWCSLVLVDAVLVLAVLAVVVTWCSRRVRRVRLGSAGDGLPFDVLAPCLHDAPALAQ